MTTKVESGARALAHDLKTYSEAAVAYALAQDWPRAVEANRSALKLSPNNIEALNRLAKALLELRDHEQAREVVESALQIDPANVIARRNRDRLEHAEATVDAVSPEAAGGIVSTHLLMSETGKSALATLIDATDRTAVGHMSSGEALALRQEGNRLLVHSSRGEAVGRVHPRLAQRIVTLIEAGNRYEAAFLRDHPMEGVQVIICEVYQHPSLEGRPSFPPSARSEFRGYMRTTRDLVEGGLGGPPERHESDEEEDTPEIDALVRAHDRGELDKATPAPADDLE